MEFTDPALSETKTLSDALAAGWVRGNPWYYFHGAFAQLAAGASLAPARGYILHASKPLAMRLAQ